MNNPAGKPETGQPTGANKRAFDRIPVNLGANTRTTQGTTFPCAIRDFSPGGMLLFFGKKGENPDVRPSMGLETGATVGVSCRVKQGSVLTLEFTALVVRVSDEGFAVRLVNPELGHLQILQKVARLQERLAAQDNKVVQASTEQKKQLPEAERKKMLQDTNQILLKGMGKLMEEFQLKVTNTLNDYIASLTSIAERNQVVDATRILYSSNKSLKTHLIENTLKKLDNYDPKSVENAYEDPNAFNMGTLALVDDDSYEDWLSDTTTIDKAENKCRESLFELYIRLSELFDLKIDKDNNPYRPALFVDCFDNTIRTLSMEHKINLICYEVFREVMLELIPTIYAEINQYLIGRQVVPVITYQTGRKKQAAKVAPPQEQQPDTESGIGETVPMVEVPAPVKEQKAQKKAEVKPEAEAKTKSEKNKVVLDEQDVRSIFDVVGDLQELREDIAEIKTRKGGGENSAAASKTKKKPAKPAKPSYSVQEIVTSLADLDVSAINVDAENGKDFNIKEQMLASLQKLAGANKQIAPRERKVIDVSDNLFKLLAADAHVSDEIRQWLAKLTVPVMKVALVDNTVFTDRNHPVRQVINKITQLEVLVEESDKENPQNSVAHNAVEWIVNLVNEEFNGTAEVFGRAIQQLDLLLSTQSKMYRKNLDTVVHDLQDHNIELIDKKELPEHEKWDVDETVKKQWDRKVNRIKESDWVVVDPKTDHPDRLRVGWIDHKAHQMALVNQVGKLDRGVTFTDVARGLNEGSMDYLGDAHDPAMDRAQYRMLEQLHTKLLDQSCHDSLTGLFDRREFEKQLVEAIENSTAEKLHCSVAFVDLDKFKLINDSCGYEAGDTLLKNITEVLRKELPTEAILARMGGDEFALLLTGKSLDDALDLMENLLEQVHNTHFEWEGKSFQLGASIGLVNVRKAGEKASEVMHEAESSCGVAKEKGGNRIVVYHAGNRGLSFNQRVVKWASELDKLLEEDQLFLKCQRIMPIRGGGLKKNKYEILLGVADLQGESILDYFIKAAERYNRMQDVDRWVIQNTFKWMENNKKKLNDIEAISINLSGCSMNDDSFFDFVKQELNKGTVPANKVCFEITETTGINSLSNASEFMMMMKETGCRFSLDDFGSGMSSYAYLKNLPVDFLKIDGVFVRDMISNPADEAVVKSICEVGHFMGMTVIAEYVENNVVLKKLQALKVDYGQGYAIEKPKLLSKL